jgi:hypothetical protein
MIKPTNEMLRVCRDDLSWDFFDDILITPDPGVEDTYLTINRTKRQAGILYMADNSAAEVDYFEALRKMK